MRAPPILDQKDPDVPSVFAPAALMREARRQKGLSSVDVPPVCILDPDGDIVCRLLTDRDEDDAAQVGPLLDQVEDPVASVTADGAYDQESVYAAVAEPHPGADVVVPPRSTAVPSATAETAPTQRDRHLQLIAEKGRMGWQKASGYNARARPRPPSAGSSA